ncbi:xanthine dehydrogenase small subunit [Marinobacter sp. ELB17]|uniref:xanthine dehydrogenase small subunit n=1 Tax=Marinobacter sp. ELB17 TaxID=270374 RepID=UPI0000F38093|nr:xanthine dehydrogenase small subunit [Marinobacter sp. ELB17]EBA00042.1 Xanthine dehydrogenase, iron-sulfur cluster and FAD-binding subunit A [Marinobacter sp. ELB17]
MIKFYLNGKPQKLTKADPNMSVLDWLRTEKRLTGTKEGCASGDCGACTVTIGSPDAAQSGQLRYDSVNSCIALVGSLHGKHLITVDALRDEPAHPVQKEMVECHGAQCGFCTPGIIMSLFALHTESAATGSAPNDEAVLESLSGNLCRCTGYRPIIDAGRKACVQTWEGNSGGTVLNRGAALSGPIAADSANAAPGLSGPAWLQSPDMIADLLKIQKSEANLRSHQGYRYNTPTTLASLRELRVQFPEARLLAGGTDLALEITQQLKDLPHLIALGGIEELQAIHEDDDGIYLGAAVTYRALFHKLAERWPHFGPMLERLGSRQIRNVGTIGGNVGNASPIGDMPPALIALGAELELDSSDGVRRIPLETFFHGYKQTDLRANEFIRGVWIPASATDEQLLIYKISKRMDDDISAVLGAFWLKRDGEHIVDCRIAFGGMAATSKRALGAEAALRRQPWNSASVSAAIAALEAEFQPMTDVRGSAAYRLQVAGNLLRRALLETSQSTSETRQPLMVTDYA